MGYRLPHNRTWSRRHQHRISRTMPPVKIVVIVTRTPPNETKRRDRDRTTRLCSKPVRSVSGTNQRTRTRTHSSWGSRPDAYSACTDFEGRRNIEAKDTRRRRPRKVQRHYMVHIYKYKYILNNNIQ